MDINPLFAESDPQSLRAWIRSYPLATLVTTGPGGLEANLLPLDIVNTAGGVALCGHVSKGHSLVRGCESGTDVLAVFQGPNAYISPRWYINGRRSGRVAPSWNYIAVEVKGRLRLVDNAAWLVDHLASLSAAQEQHRDDPWTVAGAPTEFVSDMTRRLIGFEIEVATMTGRRFMSQQRTEADRRSLIENLKNEPHGMARDVAMLMRP